MYTIEKDKIIIKDKKNFNPQHILECGQIFSYKIINNEYVVYSGKYMASIQETECGYIINTSQPTYFAHFFDLNTNYGLIKQELAKTNEFLNDAISFGYGIRILNQDIFETIISFIVSANNNIKRIQKILFAIREKFGTNMGGFYAFPTPKQLANATEQEFLQMGAGYRAKYIVNTVKMLLNSDYINWKSLPTNKLAKTLTGLSGVGPKVADCIMLFCYEKKDVFPVDTWIHKIYNAYFKTEQNRKKIRENLISEFKELSGYAQQYLFYVARSKDLKI